MILLNAWIFVDCWNRVISKVFVLVRIVLASWWNRLIFPVSAHPLMNKKWYFWKSHLKKIILKSFELFSCFFLVFEVLIFLNRRCHQCDEQNMIEFIWKMHCFYTVNIENLEIISFIQYFYGYDFWQQN